jgi:undecaprenyl-diphosphatase
MDEAVILFINGFAHKAWALDTLMSIMVRSNLIRGGVMVALLMSAWYLGKDTEAVRTNRRQIVASLMGVVIALFIARLLVLELPFRARPLNNPALGLILPFGMNPGTLSGESAFPSDHAVLFFGVATGLFAVSRRLGSFAYAIAVFVISLPRVYLGLHYPSDIIAGAALGVGSVFLTIYAGGRSQLPARLCNWGERHSSTFFAMFILLGFEIASTFDSTRMVGKFVYHLVIH